MIIIEAGGTTTLACQILDSKAGTIKSFPGISPVYMSKEDIKLILEDILRSFKNIQEVYYYGTGCLQNKNKVIIVNLIQSLLPSSKISVASDLLAAARATANKTNGQVNILGTGSASCMYSNEKIEKVFFNSGFLFGDYGSGFHLGQHFLKAFFENALDFEIEIAIQQFSGLEKKDLLRKLYASKSIKEEVANFTKCMHAWKHNEIVKNIITSSFDLFVNHQIQLNLAYKQTPQYFVGSVAHFFQEELKETLDKYEMKIKGLCQSPIEKVIGFHLT